MKFYIFNNSFYKGNLELKEAIREYKHLYNNNKKEYLALGITLNDLSSVDILNNLTDDNRLKISTDYLTMKEFAINKEVGKVIDILLSEFFSFTFEDIKVGIKKGDIKEIQDFPSYYVTKVGKVYKHYLKTNKVKEIKQCTFTGGKDKSYHFLRVNLKVGNKTTSKMVHTLVYSHFGGNFKHNKDNLIFLDGDYRNCSIDNIQSVNDLIEFYNKHNNI